MVIFAKELGGILNEKFFIEWFSIGITRRNIYDCGRHFFALKQQEIHRKLYLVITGWARSVFLGETITLTVPLSTQVCKLGTGEFNAGGNLAMV